MMASVTLKGIEGREIIVPTGLFIDNEFVPSINGATLDVENPNTGAHLATVSAAQKEDIDRAVQSSEKAFTTWKKVQPTVRRDLLNKLADLVERDGPIIASLEALEAGVLYSNSLGSNVADGLANLRYFAGWADKLDGVTLSIPQGLAYTRREPIGVCAAIIPWNTLMIFFWKFSAAIAAGNTLIVKTAELSPLWGQKIAELIKEAGFPPGVVNILTGLGNVAGQAVAEHPRIKKVAFTGSTNTGRKVMQAAAKSNLKRVTLELGGKGPTIIFDDADLENALQWASMGITIGNAELCVAGSRIYVQETIYEKFVEEFSKNSRDAIHGDPLLSETTKGAIISKAQLDKILSYIEKGKAAGFRLLHGGEKLSGDGHYVANTAFADVDQKHPIMQEEIFGPVASLASFKTEEEAIEKANDSELGLNAAIFTNNVNRAMRVSEALEVGTVTVNNWGIPHPNAPFGGVKQTGFGRDSGHEALESWLVTKTVKYLTLEDK